MPRKKTSNRLILTSFLIFIIVALTLSATLMLRTMYMKDDGGISAVAGGVSELALTGVVVGLLILAVVKLARSRKAAR